MGYLLACLGFLISGGLFIALLNSILARFGRRFWPIAVAVLLTAAFVAILELMSLSEPIPTPGADRFMRKFRLVFDLLAAGMIAITVWSWLQFAGMPRAASWSPLMLARWLFATLCLTWIVANRLDADVKQRLLLARQEAIALANSAAIPPVPDSENAALLYEAAFRAATIEQDEPEWIYQAFLASRHGTDFDFKTAKVAEFVQNNSALVASIINASKKPSCSFLPDSSRSSVNSMLSETAKLRRCASVLHVSARYHLATGQFDKAFEQTTALCRLARHVASTPFMVGGLTASGVDLLGIRTMERALSSASAAESNPHLHQLDIGRDLSFLQVARRCLYTEESCVLGTICDVGEARMRMPDNRLNHEGDRPILDTSWLYRISGAARADAEDCTYWFDKWQSKIEQGRWPNAQDTSDWKREIAEESKSRRIAPPLLETVPNTLHYLAIADARRRIATVALAMFHYRAANDRFPDQLDDLVPKYIDLPPVDPFDLQPLRLLKSDETWIIYSVGLDRIDDGGKSSDAPYSGDVAFRWISKNLQSDNGDFKLDLRFDAKRIRQFIAESAVRFEKQFPNESITGIQIYYSLQNGFLNISFWTNSDYKPHFVDTSNSRFEDKLELPHWELFFETCFQKPTEVITFDGSTFRTPLKSDDKTGEKTADDLKRASSSIGKFLTATLLNGRTDGLFQRLKLSPTQRFGVDHDDDAYFWEEPPRN